MALDDLRSIVKNFLPIIHRILFRSLQVISILVIFSILTTLAFRWIPLPISAVMIERKIDTTLKGRSYQLHYRWTSWNKLSPQAALAVIAAEDQNFISHHGFDFESIHKAINAHELGGRLRGASTISQQVAKNVFLWSGRSFIRKGLEAYFTILIELVWSKRRILEVYLNIVELGNGIFGIEMASRQYFGKSANVLTAEEAALLAAVLPNPIKLKANHPSAYVKERCSWILQQMEQLGGTAIISRL